MKKSVIKDMFNGLRGSMESMTMPVGEQRHLKTADNAYNGLIEQFSPEQLKLHEEFVAALEGSWSDAIDFYFVEGFKLGVRIGIECMDE